MTTKTNKPAKVALYCRVSTNHQDVQMQLTELRAVAAQREWDIVAEYVDEGISGSKTERPGLDQMMKDARTGKIDCVMIWRLDRLGRSLTHVIGLLDELSSMNVGFVSLKDSGIDSTSPSGRLLLQLLASFSEFEKNVIISRVRAGIRQAKSKGVHCGRPVVEVDVRPAVALLNEGRSLKETSSILNVSRSTLRRRLQSAGEWPIQGVQKAGISQTTISA